MRLADGILWFVMDVVNNAGAHSGQSTIHSLYSLSIISEWICKLYRISVGRKPLVSQVPDVEYFGETCHHVYGRCLTKDLTRGILYNTTPFYFPKCE